MSTSTRSIMLSLVLIIWAHLSVAASIPPRQIGQMQNIDDLFSSITNGVNLDAITEAIGSALNTMTLTGQSGPPLPTGTGVQPPVDATYVTKVSLVGGPEITLAADGAPGVETVLGSLTFTVAPASPSGDVTSSIEGSASDSVQAVSVSQSGASSASTSTSTTSTVSGSGSSTSSSARKTSSAESKSSTSAEPKSSTSPSSASATTSGDPNSASPVRAIDVRYFTTSVATILGGIVLGAWIV